MELSNTKITNEQLFAKLCDVEKLLKAPKVEKGLWSIDDVADYSGYSYDHIYKCIIPDPAFPKPVILTGKTRGKVHKRFLREDVIHFFENKKHS